MKDTRSRRSVLISWLFSYISVLLIPVLITTAIHAITRRTFEGEIRNANTAAFQQVRQLIDDRLSDMENLGRQIALNIRTQTLMYVKDDPAPFQRYTAAKLVQDFKLFQIADSFVDTFYVEFGNTDYVVSPDTFCKSTMFFDVVQDDLAISYEQWLSIVRGQHIADYVTLPRLQSDTMTGNAIAYMQSLPLEDPDQVAATVVIIIDGEQIRNAVHDFSLIEKGVVYLIDSRNTILSCSEPMDLPPVGYDRLEGDEGFFYEVVNGRKTAVTYVTSRAGNMKFVSLVPNELFAGKTGYIRVIALLGISLCLLLGGFVAYILVKRNYHPVYALIQSLRGRLDLSPESSENEYDHIDRAFSLALDEKDRTARLLEEQKAYLRITCLSGLLKNSDEMNQPEQVLESLGMSFRSGIFAVAVFRLDADTSRSQDMIPDTGRPERARTPLQEAVDRIGNEDLNITVIPDLDRRPCLLLNPSPVEEFTEEDQRGERRLERFLERLRDLLATEFRVSAVIGLSRLHSGLSDIAAAYSEATSALGEGLMLEGRGIISFRDIEDTPMPRYSRCFSSDDDQRLAGYLKSGDCVSAGKIVASVFRTIRSPGAPRAPLTRYVLHDMIGSMVKAVEKNVPTGNSPLSEFDPVERVFSHDDLSGMERETYRVLETLCGYITERKTSRNDRLKDDIICYITDNYTDINLCVSSVADHFGMTQAHLSKFYKKQTGENLLDAINRARLEKAKDLLNESRYSIADVARMVGLQGTNGLIRIFRRYEGVTPGTYRRISSSLQVPGHSRR